MCEKTRLELSRRRLPPVFTHRAPISTMNVSTQNSASEMTYIVSGGELNSTRSLNPEHNRKPLDAYNSVYPTFFKFFR